MNLSQAVITTDESGPFYSSELTEGLTLTSVQGDTLLISVSDGTVTVSLGSEPGTVATCLVLDILTRNGVVGT